MANEAQEKTSPTKRIMGWVGTASALIGFGASILGGVRWYENRRQHQAELASQMAVAKSQAEQGEYSSSVKSYDSILKENSLDAAALKAQLDVTMDWVENFQVIGRDGANAADAAAPQLDTIMAVLDSGLSRSKGSEAADVQAHLGWAHWLNQHIAEREFGPAAENDFRAALKLDPSNVYANAMLGNWMLQNHTSFAEAVSDLNTAAATGKARPFVRSLELGGLIYNETPGARVELFKIANQMRAAAEPLDDERKHRILSFCCNPSATDRAELIESLSAVPKDEASRTYLWLDDASPDDDRNGQQLTREFIDATLLEISGDRSGALKGFRALQLKLARQPGSLKEAADQGVKRLSSN